MVKERKRLNSQKGSLTVEMALVFPFILVFIIFICFAASMIYNRTAANSIVNKNLDKATIYWLKSNVDFETGAITSDNNSIYASLYDFDSSKKQGVVLDAINGDLQSFLLIKDISAPVKIESKNYVIFRKLKVNVTVDYGTPFKGLFKMLGVGSIKDEFEVEAVINNPVEFTRTIDFFLEIFDEFMYRFKIDNPIDKIKEHLDNFNDAIDKLNDFASS